MRSQTAWLLLAAVCALAACSTQDVVEALEGAPPLEIGQGQLGVPVSIEVVVSTGAVLPTDVRARADGGFVVLDGWSRRLLPYGRGGDPEPPLRGEPRWGHPTRFISWDDGWLLADPGAAGDPGGLVSIGHDGVVRSVLHPVDAPIALAAVPDGLLVAGRGGGLMRCGPSGVECASEAGVELVADIAVSTRGLVLAEPLAARLELGPAGALQAIGRFGQHVGALQQPKSAIDLSGALLVADSALGIVQLLDDRGRALGPLLADGALLRFDHPLAVRALGADRYVVLAAGTGEAIVFSMRRQDVDAAIAAPSKRRLRTRLPVPDAGEASGCLQCHDGFVRNGRRGWDPRRQHHPVDVVPERPLPPFFPLDDSGRITCGTCHSPHGTSTSADAGQTRSDRDRAALVRHKDGAWTRMATRDGALCAPCHEESAHGGLMEHDGLVVGVAGHPVGEELRMALARRGDSVAEGGCLGCHTPHGAQAEPLLRGAEVGDTCLGCHAEQAEAHRNHPVGATFAADGPRPRASARLALDGGGGVGCVTCHDTTGGTAQGLLRARADGGPLCLACHGDQMADLTTGHGGVRGAFGVVCLGCHDPHGPARDEHLVRPARRGTDGCLGCHGEGAPQAPPGSSPGRRGHPVTGEDLDGCASCHDVHDAAAPPADCAGCHEDPAAEAARHGGHGGVPCVDCHPAHAAPLPPPPSAADANPSARPCLACHASDASGEGPTITHASHPDPVFAPDGSRWTPLAALPLFAADGTQQPPATNGALTCGSCHRTHGAGPDDVEPLRRAGILPACAACHGSDALPLLRWFHLPDRRADILPPGADR